MDKNGIKPVKPFIVQFFRFLTNIQKIGYSIGNSIDYNSSAERPKWAYVILFRPWPYFFPNLHIKSA